MDHIEEEYKRGFEKGYLIGRTQAYLKLVKTFIEKGYVQNCEDAMRYFEVEEIFRARLMDYITIEDYESWGSLSDEGWEEREDLIYRTIKAKRFNQ